MKYESAVDAYRRMGAARASTADPAMRVSMLMQGALDRLAAAGGALAAGRRTEKARHIGRAVAIIDTLGGSLDREAGGEIAANLAALYGYMLRRLLQANLRDDADALAEVGALLRQVKSGWDAATAGMPAGAAAQAG